MPLQNNDVLLVNRGGESHRYSFENLKRDVLSDIELQLTGLEWVARNPTGATEISALQNTASTPRDWDTVDVLLFGPGNDLSEVTLGATVLLTNVTSGHTGTYDVVGVNAVTRQIDVTYISDTGGDIAAGNTFQVAVLSLGASGVQISETPPDGAQQGQLWWNTDDGRLYVFYEDGDSSQWVDASPDTLVDQHWQRAGTTLSPVTAGDDVDLGTGDLSAAAGTFSGDVGITGGLSATGNSWRISDVGQIDSWGNAGYGLTIADTSSGTAQETIVLNRDGSATFSGDVQIGADPNTSTAVGGIKAYAGGAMDLFRASTSRRSSMLTLFSLVGTGDSKQKVFSVDVDGEVRVGGDIDASPNITLNADGAGVLKKSIRTDAQTGTADNFAWSVYRENNDYVRISHGRSDANPFSRVGTEFWQTRADGTSHPVLRIHKDTHQIVLGDTLGADGAGTPRIQLNQNGAALKDTGASWGGISDVRMKSNIADYTAGLSDIKQLQPRIYNFHGKEDRQIGFVAQEIEGVMPEMVDMMTGTLPDGTEVDDLRSVNISALHFAAVNAIKEMATRIEALEAEVQQLKGGN